MNGLLSVAVVMLLTGRLHALPASATTLTQQRQGVSEGAQLQANVDKANLALSQLRSMDKFLGAVLSFSGGLINGYHSYGYQQRMQQMQMNKQVSQLDEADKMRQQQKANDEETKKIDKEDLAEHQQQLDKTEALKDDEIKIKEDQQTLRQEAHAQAVTQMQLLKRERREREEDSEK